MINVVRLASHNLEESCHLFSALSDPGKDRHEDKQIGLLSTCVSIIIATEIKWSRLLLDQSLDLCS